MKEYGFHGNSHTNCGGKLASSMCPYNFGVQTSDNLCLFDILSKALSQSLSPWLVIIHVHTKTVRHIKDVKTWLMGVLRVEFLATVSYIPLRTLH